MFIRPSGRRRHSEIARRRSSFLAIFIGVGLLALPSGATDLVKVDYPGFTQWLDCAQRGPVVAQYMVGPDTGNIDIKHHFRFDEDHETARRHAEDRAFIEAELSKARDAGLAAVVITHHAPSPRCVRPWFASSSLNAGFASDLEETTARFRPALWVHGHIHDAVDETLGETRVIANPRGYPGVEGRDFDQALVLEV